MKVKNMLSPRTRKEVANQFIIETEAGTYFQSYKSIIAFKPSGGGAIQLDKTFWNYSRTTAKYRNEFLRLNSKEVEHRINEGQFILTNLN